MAWTDELIEKVDKAVTRISNVEAKLVTLGRGETPDNVIRKTLKDGRGGAAATIGFEGSDTLGLLRYISGPKQKALGWGRFLNLVVDSSDTRKDQTRINKSLESMGARAITKTALAEGAGITGGYTVPVQFYADLMRLVAEDSFTRSLCTILPMQSRTMLIPAIDHSASPGAGTSAFFGGLTASWQPEAQTIAESEPTFRQIELVARDLVFTSKASNQLLQDNAVALDTMLTTLFKESMSWFFDYYVLRGTGANQPLGTLTTTAAVSVSRSAAGSFVLDDAAQMMSRLLMSSWKNAVWVMHPSVLPSLIRMTSNDTSGVPQGNLVWLNPYGSGNKGPMAQDSPASLIGRPIYFTEKVPKLGTAGDVQLVDFSKIVVGDRMALQIETSPHVGFLQNQMTWRIIQRWDAQPWLNAPITLADGSGTYTVSPIIKLAA